MFPVLLVRGYVEGMFINVYPLENKKLVRIF